MNNRRDFQQERYGRGRGDARSFSREQHRGQQDWRSGGSGGGSDWDVDSREGASFGAGQDRSGSFSGSMDYGNPYEPRRRGEASRQETWDEDRFGYPESGRQGREWMGRDMGHDAGGDRNREMGRGRESGYGAPGRFGEDRYSWGQRYGQQDDDSRMGGPHGGSDRPRHFEPRQRSSWESSWGQGGGGSDAYAGGRSGYGGGPQGGLFGGWGIPSGSEPGGYGMNGPSRGGGQQNWSGSNWGHQGGSPWGGDHSGRFGAEHGAQTSMRGRTPKGYTRSDERIKDDVCEQLYRTPDIDVSEVTVEVRNGTVTLEGTVPDRRMKHRLEDLCEQCIGVQDVENRIRVQREERGDGSRFGSSSATEDRPMSGGGTAGASERSNKKPSTGTSSSSH